MHFASYSRIHILTLTLKCTYQCRGTYTSKIEGMLNDFMLADVLDKDFESDFLLWKSDLNDRKMVS